jgi:radical SAM/Cys-rich protein
MSSVIKRKSILSTAQEQIEFLERTELNIPSFTKSLKTCGLYPLKPEKIEIFQVNLGKMCNQVCKHCHVDAGPTRKEVMTRETMELCLTLVKKHGFKTVDLTGGAPEMNPHFRWFVQELSSAGAEIIVRCNLTIILANKAYNDLPLFFKEHNVQIVSSLPHYTSARTDRQRGEGVFDQSIKALKMLNEVGYGKDQSNLSLNLVYNPTGAFLPGDQKSLEREFKHKLKRDFDIDFNHLYCITNMPISRYLEFLIESGNYENYMATLISNFNPAAAKSVMCRNTLSVGWDGKLYDCDFNQMLELEISHLDKFDLNLLQSRSIRLGQHCFGCTAGSGSSCGGSVA